MLTKNPVLRFKNAKGENYPDWESKRLGEVCYSKASKVIKNQLTFLSNGYPVYGADGIIGYLDKYDAIEDYISIVKDGAGCGRVLYCSKNSSILSTLQYIYTKENLFFLFIILQNINFSNYIIGSTIPHLYFKHYSNHIINIPHIEEQNKIGKFLKSVDDKIEITSKKLKHLKQYKTALMQQLFPQNNQTNPSLRFKNAKGEDYPDWESKKLGEVGEISTGKANARDNEDFGIYPLFDRSGVIKSSSKYLFDGENIIVPGEGYKFLPKYFIGKFNLHQRAYTINNFKNINGKFLYYFIEKNSVYLLQNAVCSTVPSLRLPIFINWQILLPQIEEQNKIGKFLKSVDDKIEITSKKLKHLKTYKRALMQQLFPCG